MFGSRVRSGFAAFGLCISAFTACADGSIADPSPLAQESVAAADALTGGGGGAFAPTLSRAPAPIGGVCANLAVPAGSRLHIRLYANGVQIYQWTGTQWSFVAPSAVLTAERNGGGVVGTHYAGPSWESLSGSLVTGAVRERCTPDPSAIAWLLLDATPAAERGIFRDVAFIQRINTVGGLAPTQPGSVVGEEARVPYTTEYLFFRQD